MSLNKVNRDLTSREQAVPDCIPTGHANAVTRRRLARMACLDDRLIREIIYRLVVERGCENLN